MKPSKLSSKMVWSKYLLGAFFSVAGLLSLTRCQYQGPPSVIILAFDRMAFNSFACSDEKIQTSSGLSTLCHEGLRFTHAYTTSTNSAAAMGSLLTAKYPFEHKLHRGSDRIDPKTISLQEIANKKGYRTAFWSGSPIILKKTGLSKSFDLFDDSTFLENKNYIAQFSSETKQFLNWSAESSMPFLAVIHNSELENLNEGESEISSFEKLDEKLAQFFHELKKRNLWENNYIIVTGLQGVSNYNRVSETNISNLHSENTNTLLFIKPPRSKGDEGISWKIDTSVNLADLSLSLMKTLDPGFELKPSAIFPIFNFSYLWLKTRSDENNLPIRKLLIESTNTWTELLETRFSIVYKNLIYLEDKSENHEVYNFLTDGLETINIAEQSKEFLESSIQELSQLRDQYELRKWVEYQPTWYNLVLSNQAYWANPNNRVSTLEAEMKRLLSKKTTQPLSALLLQHLLSKNKKGEIATLPFERTSDLIRFLLLKQTERDIYFEYAKRNSLNLALENIWHLWAANRNWLYSPTSTEYQ